MISFNIKGLNIQIKPLFLFLILGSFFFGYFKELSAIIIFVTLHEIAHIVTARYFKLYADRIVITPIGQFSNIRKIESLEPFKKYFIILAGPIFNFAVYIVIKIFFVHRLEFIAASNLAICVFNLLPAYPLDGGRILHFIFSYMFGVLRANKIMIKITVFVAGILIILGVLQTVLYCYNISLLCVGFYLLKSNKKNYMNMTFEFYRNIVQKKSYAKIMTIRNIYVDKNIELKKIIQRFGWDYYVMLYICEGDRVYCITENRFIEYIQSKGLNGTIEALSFFQHK